MVLITTTRIGLIPTSVVVVTAIIIISIVFIASLVVVIWAVVVAPTVVVPPADSRNLADNHNHACNHHRGSSHLPSPGHLLGPGRGSVVGNYPGRSTGRLSRLRSVVVQSTLLAWCSYSASCIHTYLMFVLSFLLDGIPTMSL